MTERDARRPPLADERPLERYLQILSGAWVARILWFLRFGPRRYGELRRDLKAVSPKVLTAKLRALEADGFVVRRVAEGPLKRVEYSLSDRGRAFEAVLQAMERVARGLDELSTGGQASTIIAARRPADRAPCGEARRVLNVAETKSAP